MIRLAAFDLDGTTLKNHGELSPENRRAILAAAQQGVLTVPATGRLYSFLPPSLMSLPCIRYIVACNGAVVYDRVENRVLAANLIPTQQAVALMDLADAYNVYYEFYADGEAYTMRDHIRIAMEEKHFPENRRVFLEKAYRAEVEDQKAYILEQGICPEKINLTYVPPEIRGELAQKLRETGWVEVASSRPDNLEINAAGVSKGSGLAMLCQKLHIDPSEVLAMGDEGNDLSMLHFAGVPVAMGNAPAAVQAAAVYVTARCEEDGAAQALRRFIPGI